MSRITNIATIDVRRTDGQTAAEYAVVLAVLASTAALLFATLGGRIIDALNSVVGLLP
jgi:Flp pilus assembly pilin Flp